MHSPQTTLRYTKDLEGLIPLELFDELPSAEAQIITTGGTGEHGGTQGKTLFRTEM
jgi:hypothetical protein